MVHKETCPRCKGNRFIDVEKTPNNKSGWIKCPSCGGQGYKVKMSK